MGAREELREKVKKILENPKYQDTEMKAPVHEVPTMDKDNEPPKGWKQDEKGNWLAPGWKKVGDTFATENEEEEEED